MRSSLRTVLLSAEHDTASRALRRRSSGTASQQRILELAHARRGLGEGGHMGGSERGKESGSARAKNALRLARWNQAHQGPEHLTRDYAGHSPRRGTSAEARVVRTPSALPGDETSPRAPQGKSLQPRPRRLRSAEEQMEAGTAARLITPNMFHVEHCPRRVAPPDTSAAECGLKIRRSFAAMALRVTTALRKQESPHKGNRSLRDGEARTPQ